MRERGELKVYSYARPHCQRFNGEEFATVGQFQHAVEEWFGIALDDQKFVMDGKLLGEKWRTAPFRQLKITANSHLVVLTKTHKTFKKKASSKPAESKIDQSIANIGGKGYNQLPHNNDVGSTKILNCLKDPAINTLITHFIRALGIPKAELLLLDESKLRFVLKKISMDSPLLQEILLGKLDTVKQALIDEAKLQSARPSFETAPAEAVNFLVSLSYSRERAVRALEICRNDIYSTLNLLCGNSQQDSIVFEVKKESLISEFISISQWLGRPANKPLLLLLKHKPDQLPIFMNYWKHVCPDLFETMARWQSYLPNLLGHHQAKAILP